MKPVLLDKRVTLQQKVAGQDPTGAPLTGWENVITTGDGKLWANIRDLSGHQFVVARAGQNATSTTIRIRKRAGVVPAMRVLHGADVYDIEAVLERDNTWLDLMCAKGLSSG
jgi:SPP1 family predicted phage head-tail adaptor